jgi:hypothetical protein
MDILRFERTDDTPEVLLSKIDGIFEISGRSLPEDSVEFYRPLLEWIDQYKKSPNPTTEFVLKLDYINTASSKLIQDVLLAFEGIKGAKVTWYFQDDDEDMEAMGREYAELVKLPFEFKSY